MRLDNGVCSGQFAVKQGLHQGCVLAPLLSNIFFAVVMNVAYTRFKADKDITDALVHLRKKTGARAAGGEIVILLSDNLIQSILLVSTCIAPQFPPGCPLSVWMLRR